MAHHCDQLQTRSLLIPGSPQTACARQLYESLYGPDAAQHRATAADYQQKEKAFREADARLDWMSDSDAWTVDRMKEVIKEKEAAEKARDEARRAYEWIPHEADAFRVGDRIEALW